MSRCMALNADGLLINPGDRPLLQGLYFPAREKYGHFNNMGPILARV